MSVPARVPAGVLLLTGGDDVAALASLVRTTVSAQGATVTDVDLVALGLPLFKESASSTVPAPVAKLLANIQSHRGIVIVAPELYGTMAPVVQNALVWLASASPQRDLLRDKVMTLMASCPTGGTGLKALSQLAAVLGGLGALVLPYPVGVGAHAMAGGRLTDPTLELLIAKQSENLTATLARMPEDFT